MTLTEMLEEESKELGSILRVSETKEIFKQWLKEVGLSDHDTIGKGGYIFSATESTRDLLILLVDEPSKEDCSVSL